MNTTLKKPMPKSKITQEFNMQHDTTPIPPFRVSTK